MIAACREVREETSLITPNPRQFHISDNGEVVYFVADHYGGEVKIDFEHDDFAWVYPEDLTSYDRVSILDEVIALAKEAL